MARPLLLIEGASGTVGLTLWEKLKARTDIEVHRLTPVQDSKEQTRLLAAAWGMVLCLPEAQARRRAQQLPRRIRLLDASGAHRLEDSWVYGLPELGSSQREAIVRADRVANPGCFATGAILLLAPLRRAGFLDNYPLAIQGTNGYSAGGRSMMQRYEANPFSYRVWLDLDHRHVPEIARYAGLATDPILMPAVAGHRQGLLVQIPLSLAVAQMSAAQIQSVWQDAYAGTGVRVATDEPRAVDADDLAGSDGVVLRVVTSRDSQNAMLVASYDNLGKGAAGALLENLNLMLGY